MEPFPGTTTSQKRFRKPLEPLYSRYLKQLTVSSMSLTFTEHLLVQQQLRMEGFIVTRWLDRWNEALAANAKWIHEGKLKVKETTVEGFDKMPEALIGLFTGDNIGKMVVKA